MKKLFAIVMVLAMALAIAAPALASGWDQLPTTAPTFKDITIKITALETEMNTSVLGGLYEQLKVMYPVVKGTEVHFFVEITIPGFKNLSEKTWTLLLNKQLQYNLDLSNLELTEAYTYVDGDNEMEITHPEEGLQATIFVNDDYDTAKAAYAADKTLYPAVTFGYEYWAKGIEAGKDGVAVATIGFYNVWNDGMFDWDNNADGEDEFIVYHDDTDGEFVIEKQNDPDFDYVLFPVVEATGKIDVTREILFGYDGDVYAVNRSVTSELTFRNTDDDVVTSASSTGYAALKAAFDSFFTALGFGYADAKYMSEDHFTKYFGTIMETSVKIVYPSGAVVVAPPAVKPPQTGDATTVVGFVMIALALVAAAAVTVRKVRA